MSATILVVEDNYDMSQLMARLFDQFEGVKVITAKDGVEGLKRAEVENPSLIITDLQMPRLNGIEMIKKIRAHPQLREIPILVLSAYADENTVAAIKAGADGVLDKTRHFDLLLRLVRDVLHPRVA